MATGLLIKVEDWRAFYVDRTMVMEEHNIDVEFLVNYAIENKLSRFVVHSPNDDVPSEHEPLARCWYVPDDSPREYGWWEFPPYLGPDLWLKLTS